MREILGRSLEPPIKPKFGIRVFIKSATEVKIVAINVSENSRIFYYRTKNSFVTGTALYGNLNK